MNKKEFMKRLVHLPLIGEFIGRQLLRFYKPNALVPVYEFTGNYGERMYFEELAATRNTSEWMFKVYTSERAQEDLGILTTIWLERVELSHLTLNEEQRQRLIEHEFKKCRHKYNAYMQENLQSFQWDDVANARSFVVNASGTVADREGFEKPISEYHASDVVEKVAENDTIPVPS